MRIFSASVVGFPLFGLLLVSFCMLTGCSQQNKPKDLPRLYERSITFTQEGAPLQGSVVFLAPVGESKWNASGSTNDQGVAVLYTQGQYKGVAEGTYKVTVCKETCEVQVTPSPRGDPIEKTIFYSHVDLQYKDVDTTPLEVTITAKMEPLKFDVGPAKQTLIRNP